MVAVLCRENPPQNIFVSGIPASGKTTYCHLGTEKGFLHLDFDERVLTPFETLQQGSFREHFQGTLDFIFSLTFL
jgi:hypothetical protein